MMSFADAQPTPTDCSSIGVDRFRQDLLDRRAADKRKTAELSTSRSRKKIRRKKILRRKNSAEKKVGAEKIHRSINSHYVIFCLTQNAVPATLPASRSIEGRLPVAFVRRGRDAASLRACGHATHAPGGSWVKPSGAIRPRLVQQPLKAKAGLPRGAPRWRRCIRARMHRASCARPVPVTPGRPVEQSRAR